ncbi:MAG: gfo/Idh/MocA family oxidoreductase [Nitrososphaerota archaeon]
MVKIAVIGVGGWGKNHARALHELGALGAVCDIDPQRADLYSKLYSVPGYTDFEALLAEARPDGVVVATPPATHYELGLKLIERGIPLLLEKPMALTAKEARQLATRAEQRGVTMLVGYIERYNPAVAYVKQLIKEGRLGKLQALELHRENRRPPQARNVGIIIDTSVHDIDTARWLWGSEPRWVYCTQLSIMGEREDFAVINLRFQDGVAVLFSNWVTPTRKRYCVAIFTEGIVSFDFITQEVRIEHQEAATIPRNEFKDVLQAELSHFIACIEGRERPLVGPWDGVAVNEIAEAAMLSSRFNTPVYLKG